MLFINNQINLKKEKIRFFNDHLDFIQQYMPTTIKEYVSAFLNGDFLPVIDIENISLETIHLTTPDNKLYYCVIYVCLREIDNYWNNFFHYIQSLSLTLDLDFSSSFTFDNTSSPQSKLYTIRQCRVDKPKYTNEVKTNIGFYNKNENFNYLCYDNQDAIDYITQYCSPEALAAYNNIQYPQGKSDFFLVASLYSEGGISVDVCSVAQSNLEILIKNIDFLLIYDEDGIHKKFIFAHPQNPFILYHLNCLIQKMSYFGADKDYDDFSSRSAFHHNFMDYYAFYYQYIKDIPITFLHNNIYNAFVHDEIIEEDLSTPTDFPFVVASGAFKEQKLSLSSSASSNLKMQTNNFYMAPTKDVIVIGHNNYPNFSNRVKTPYSLPPLNVWEVENVHLAGLGWLWKDGQYINLESHLSNLAFDPNWRGKFKQPASDDITETIYEECIVVISAGYPCYGHYLVDDIPRIGLIRDYLGKDFYNKKFIISTLTPQWAKDILKFFFELNDTHFLYFNEPTDIWKLKKVFIPSFPSRNNYDFHQYIYDFYKRYYTTNVQPHRLVCLSRSLCNPNSKHQRVFQNREFFEYIALSYGFEVICPETLSIQEQMQLMAETACQIGEHGSAQHSSVFNPHGMIVGTINPIGDVQIALGRIYKDQNILCYLDEFYWGGVNNETFYYNIEQEKLINFFDQITEALQKRK